MLLSWDLRSKMTHSSGITCTNWGDKLLVGIIFYWKMQRMSHWCGSIRAKYRLVWQPWEWSIYVNDLVENLYFHSEVIRKILPIVYIKCHHFTMFIQAILDKMAWGKYRNARIYWCEEIKLSHWPSYKLFYVLSDIYKLFLYMEHLLF